MLCRAYNIPEETEGENFIDAGDTYYTGYILALKNRNLINGTGDNMVSPKKEITRQELIVMMHNIMKYTNNLVEENEKTETIFTDENEIAEWAKNSVTYFIQNKIIVGSNGKINPRGNTTRAEMVQILYNLNVTV